MTKQEYESLCDRKTPLICGNDLKNQDNRTLLWGYTTSRASWHVYLAAGVIHTVIYDYGKEPEEQPVASNADYVPNKRVYPEASDFEFCKLLIDRGVCIPYTSFSADRVQQRYYGKILSSDMEGGLM